MAAGVKEQLKTWKDKVAAGPLPSLVVLVSESGTVLDRARDTLLDEALPPAARALNRQSFPGAGSSPSAWLVAVRSAPMMAKRRLVAITDADSWLSEDPPWSEGEEQAFAKFAKTSSPSRGILLLTGTAFSRNGPVAKLAQEHGWLVSFDVETKGHGIEELVTQIFRQRKVSIDQDAVDSLIDALGASLDTLQPEIEKLAAFAGPGGHISRHDIVDMVQRLQGHHLYEFSSAVASRDANKALTVLDRLYRNLIDDRRKTSINDLPLRLLSYVATDFSNMAIASGLGSGDVAALAEKIGGRTKAGGKRSFQDVAAKKAMMNARRFTEAELSAALQAIRDVDRRLKSTGLPHRLLIENLVFAICTRAGRTGGPSRSTR